MNLRPPVARSLLHFLATCLVAANAMAAPSGGQLKPGAVLRFEFPELSPNVAEMFRKETDPPVPNTLVIDLPANYTPARQFPIVIYIDGGNGGNYLSSKWLRDVLGPNDFIAVRLPLFKADKIPTDPARGLFVMQKDFPVIRKYYRVMLEKLFATVPNVTPRGSTLGGFSNGAHTTAVLLQGGDEFIRAHFDQFYFVEGGMPVLRGDVLQKPELRAARVLVMLGDRGRGETFAKDAWENLSAARDAGVDVTYLAMRGYGHEWPLDYKKLLPLWLRAQPFPEIAPKPAGVPSKPAESVERDRPAGHSPVPSRNIPVVAAPAETKEQRDARMAWWREAKFGMFLHWGLYAVPGGLVEGKPAKARDNGTLRRYRLGFECLRDGKNLILRRLFISGLRMLLR